MYIPKQFNCADFEQVKQFIEQNGFGILLSTIHGRPYGTHIPLYLDSRNGQYVLTGHIARANKQWTEFEDNSEVLVIFSGPHSYISSSWYDHVNVPTWNYRAVHVYGKIKVVEGEALRLQLEKLVNKYEANMAHPVSVDGLPDEFVRKQMKGIVGFEIEITEWQMANKMSQNRDAADKHRIAEGLLETGDNNSIEVAGIIKDSMAIDGKQ